jgi:hypothetical protein
MLRKKETRSFLIISETLASDLTRTIVARKQLRIMAAFDGERKDKGKRMVVRFIILLSFVSVMRGD